METTTLYGSFICVQSSVKYKTRKQKVLLKNVINIDNQ